MWSVLLPLIAAIPYFRPDELKLVGGLAIQPWGVMVAAGFMLGSRVCQHHAIKRGIDPKIYADVVVWLAVGALVFGHLGHVLYEPELYKNDPIRLLKVWDGLSSMGGFFGCSLLAVIFFRRRGLTARRGGDILMIGLAFGYVLGRLGCFIVHDHPGRTTAEVEGTIAAVLSPLAVDYPTAEEVEQLGDRMLREGRYPELSRAATAGGRAQSAVARDAGMRELHIYDPRLLGTRRFDLGLMDALHTLLVFALLSWLARKPQREGLLLAVMPLTYMPVRFCWDFLRASDLSQSDVRYGELTPAQYGCIVLFLAGAALWAFGVRTAKVWPEPDTRPWDGPRP